MFLFQINKFYEHGMKLYLEVLGIALEGDGDF